MVEAEPWTKVDRYNTCEGANSIWKLLEQRTGQYGG
ncbi:hypothetical protein AA0112_g12400 [Alternaria arborescens]|nr:hypothetical protein AA0112_g12400 [Alternaria arborescens]